MNSIRKYISHVVGEDEDQMDITDDDEFTEQYLSQFKSIESHTIDVLVSNGYQTKETLLAFDLKEDLPLLPDVNMAQKSILRKVLQQFFEEQELESKVNDIKGVDEELALNNSLNNKMKRKRETISESPSSLRSKRSRVTELMSDLESEYQTNSGDGLGSRMKQMVSGRKSIRSSAQRNFETDVNPNLFEFSNNNRDKYLRSRLSQANQTFSKVSDNSNESSEEELEEQSQKRISGRIKVERNVDTSRNSYSPFASTPSITKRNSLLSDSSGQMRSSIAPLARLGGRMSANSTPTSTTKRETPGGSHVPTPTELEVREHLAKQKALGKNKRGRKRT